jgi:5-formyltetrahydrofolate cyclo-ligase
MRAMMRQRRAEAAKAHGIPHRQALVTHALSCASTCGFTWSGERASLYLPIRSEIDTRGLIEALRAEGAIVSAPRIEGGDLVFRRYDAETALAPGAYGVMEPTEASPIIEPTVIFAPLLAFDRRGGRLGYGAGYYDRAIARCRPRLAIGLAFAAQEVDEVPTDANDRPLDLVATERGVIDCRAA